MLEMKSLLEAGGVEMRVKHSTNPTYWLRNTSLAICLPQEHLYRPNSELLASYPRVLQAQGS